jgi:hypothetical protein
MPNWGSWESSGWAEKFSYPTGDLAAMRVSEYLGGLGGLFSIK